MTKYSWGVVAALVVSGIAASAQAAPLMPDYSALPAGWVTDRYDPNSFSNVGTYQGRDNVLGIGITPAEGYNNRIGGFQNTFYNTQGRQHAISGGAGSTLSADIYIPQDWSNPLNGSRRTDMWGVMTDGSSVTDYPIIGFTNYGGAPRLRLWDDVNWVDLVLPVSYDTWTSLEIKYTGTAYEYLINGSTVYTDLTINGSTGFSATIMQAYNFCGDPSIPDGVCSSYIAHWANTQVPEPATLAVLGMGLLGLGMIRRRDLMTKLIKTA